MSNQIQVSVDQTVYNRLLELQVPPYNDINSVIERLLFHSGRKSNEVIQLEADERHFSYEEEVQQRNGWCVRRFRYRDLIEGQNRTGVSYSSRAQLQATISPD